MADQIPIKVLKDGSDNTCGLAQFSASDTLAVAVGGTGLTTQGVCAFVQPGVNAVACKSTYLGICAGKSEGEAKENTYVGYAAGQNVTTGCYHTIIGSNAGDAITTCSGTVLVGYNAGTAITMGDFNTLVGTAAGAAVVTASNNTAIGYHAATATICSNNIAIGTCALVANTQGQGNIAIGLKAGATQVAAGCNNIFIGSSAGAVALCRDNIMVGNNAGIAATTGGGNIMIGACVGYGVVGGDGNVYIGDKAGLANTSGNDNVFIGKCAGCASTASCTLIIGNGTCDLITGAFNTPSLTIAGTLYIDDTFVSNGKGVVVGNTAQVAMISLTPELEVLGTAVNDSSLGLGIWANDAYGPTINFSKSRQTTIGGSAVVVADNDVLGQIQWTGDDGVDLTNAFARFGVRVDDAGPGNNAVATEFFFQTTTTGGAIADRVNIGPTGVVKFSNAYCFPTADGSADQVLCTDGSGALKFVAMGGASAWSTSGCFITTPSGCFVGIGTTAPEDMVHVYSTDNIVMRLDSLKAASGSTLGPILELALTGGTGDPGQAGDTLGSLQFDGQGNDNEFAGARIRSKVVVGNTTRSAMSTNLEFMTMCAGEAGANNVRMTIDPDGNVGIGTATPASPLSVVRSSTAYVLSHSTAASAGFKVQTANTNFVWYANTGSNALRLYDNNAGAERMHIDSDGAVLMGSMPSFGAYNSVLRSDVTGDGTYIAAICFDTEIRDNGGNFNGKCFVAPVAGVYTFSANVKWLNLTSAMDYSYSSIYAGGMYHYVYAGPWEQSTKNSSNGVGIWSQNWNVAAVYMNAGDAAYVAAAITSGGKTADIAAATGGNGMTFFTGALLY